MRLATYTQVDFRDVNVTEIEPGNYTLMMYLGTDSYIAMKPDEARALVERLQIAIAITEKGEPSE